MKPAGWIAAIVGLAAAGAIVWAVARAPVAKTLSVAAPVPATAGMESQRAALQATPQARAYEERQTFERQARDFLREAPKLGAVARSEQARTLSASIDGYERIGQMSAGEALMLRIALIRAGSADDADTATRIAEMTERYRTATERREAAWEARQNSDPRFQDYKLRERAVVAEVMALREIPGGLSRDEYLRRRLEQERVRAYR